jgi:hypothetical protein
MARKAKFFAWAAPASGIGRLADHTWVTTYDSRTTVDDGIKSIIAANEHFWYCWGIFRSKGKALDDRLGDLDEALCLVQPDATCRLESAARGTIFSYGYNGVCHQLANQVLHAPGSPSSDPLTVKGARGYGASIFRYGTYGIPISAWDLKRDACRSRRSRKPHLPDDGTIMAQDLDEFEIRARTVLKDQDPKVLFDLLALRKEAQKVPPQTRQNATAQALNADTQRMLDRAASLLGPINFERIFEFPPEQRVDLVNALIL